MLDIKTNSVANALNGIFGPKKDISKEELKEDFDSVGKEQVILSLNKAYELSGDKKENILIDAMLLGFEFVVSVYFLVLLIKNNNDILYFIPTIINVLSGIAFGLLGYKNYHKLNDILAYTKEAELYILDVKPEAMKDLIEKKYENTAGARVKSMFNRNKKEM